MLIARTQALSLEAKDSFGYLFCLGVAAMWLFQSLVNIGMNLGIMPITGIPLPFISAGGSAMIKNLMAVGILLNIYRRRFD
jgi:rod shape determining protein RodA